MAAQPQPAAAGVNVWTSGGPPDAVVIAVAVDPNAAGTVYAGTAGKGVFKSTNGGATWLRANTGLGELYIEDLLVDPVTPDTVYAASPNQGVFKSIDGAAHWFGVNAGLASTSAHLLAIDAASSTLYVSINDGVFKSFDGGGVWVPTALETRGDPVSGDDVALRAAVDCLAIDPTSGAIYACLFNWMSARGLTWQLLKSMDGGDTWDNVSMPPPGGPYAVAIDPASPGTIYAATYDACLAEYAVMKSTPDGADWDRVGTTLPGCEGSCRISALAYDAASKTLYAAADAGVYAIDAGADAWRPLNTGIAGRPMISIAVAAADSARIYAGSSSGVYAIEQAPSCGGDCDANQLVTIDELIAAISIALGERPMQACGAADLDSDGYLAASDVIAAVNHALHGCPTAADR
jgi:hypothetical protein